MACTSQPSPMPRQASKKVGRSGHGLSFPRGAEAPGAVAQPKAGQRHAKSKTCTSESLFRAHAPRFHTCASGSASERTADSVVGYPEPTDDPSGRATAGGNAPTGVSFIHRYSCPHPRMTAR